MVRPQSASISIVAQLCTIVFRMNPEELKARARVMKALASPVRLKIVDELSRGERCLCELQPLFPMNKSTLSRHVAELRNVGIVGERREGVRSYLRLLTPCVLKMFDCAMGVIRAAAKRQTDLANGGR
jgi:DNA-binding transcriptional ArsR family regulator